MSSIPSLLAKNSTNSTTSSSSSSSSSTTTSLSEAVKALTTLEAGAKALRGMPGRTSRSEALASIRSQIQTLLKPQLLHALQRMETRLGPLQSCVGMYAALGKMEALTEEYVRSRPGSVHRLWFEFKSGLKKKGVSTTAGAGGRLLVDDGTNVRKSAVDDLEFYGEEKQSTTNDDDDYFAEETVQRTTTTTSSTTAVSGVEDPAKEFVEWLPTWYEAVLLLLGEERRRSLFVFGSDLAPEIIAKVLNECFRPILSSFQTRLSAIYSPDDNDNHTSSTTTTSSGSFESICATYEATLQFLSVAYEQMVEFDGTSSSLPSSPTKNNTKSFDGISSGGGVTDGATSKNTTTATTGIDPATTNNTKTKTPVQIFMMIRSIFVSIASPFAPYQIEFARLEKRHSELAGRIVSRNIHEAVMGTASTSNTSVGGKMVLTLSNMQDSIERLGGLASFMFPLAQAAIARFESLNSGYCAQDALTTIDSLLSQHVGEISIAIDTLSTNLFSNQDAQLTENFDEQQVLCALEVLKIAGVIRRDLNMFQGKTRDRLRVLVGRMSATIDQHDALMGAISENSRSASLVPESLSAVEVEALLAKSTCGDSHGDDSKSNAVSSLQYLANVDQTLGDIVPLFPDSFDSTNRLVRTCQAFVFDVCSAIPMKNLSYMTSLPVWKEESTMASVVDSYGTLPQSYITHVGEHMLALVQALEPFASNEDALQLANFAMENVERIALQPWKDFVNAINCTDSSDIDAILALASGRNMKDYIINNFNLAFDDGEDEEDDDGMNNSNPKAAKFCNLWLDAVCSAVTGRLLDRTMRIHVVSQKGCEHLAADFNYLINVFSALGISGHPHCLLTHVVGILKMDATELQARISAPKNDGSAAAATVHSIDERLALMRGIIVD